MERPGAAPRVSLRVCPAPAPPFTRGEPAMIDHRRLGRDLEIFHSAPMVGAGLPIWLPAGGRRSTRHRGVPARARTPARLPARLLAAAGAPGDVRAVRAPGALPRRDVPRHG